MRTNIYLIFLIHLLFFGTTFAQSLEKTFVPDTSVFNYSQWNGVADREHMTKAERAEFISGQKQVIIHEQREKFYHDNNIPHNDKDLIWVTEPSSTPSKGYSQNGVSAGPCTNIDFESGTMNGWIRSTGFNPLNNPIGCCATAGGDQTLMTGGTDPFGGFPRVYPGGGGFSLRLGSTANGGRADRISQTFFVTSANANFTYRYAVVLNDGGHTAGQQPRFTSEIIDSLGNPVSCTFYQVSAALGLTGYTTSSITANGNSVVYKPWTDVIVDLSPNIGQNVTIRFTVYDCYATAHFAYVYIDGVCTSFATSTADTTCANVPKQMCAPLGFANYSWNGPAMTTNTNQCINPMAPGVYTCSTILVPGCPGPSFTHTLTALPVPQITFSAVRSSTCSPTFSFANTGTISSGAVVVYQYSFGDGTSTTSTALPAPFVKTYTAAGTYTVKLRAISNLGCRDSVTQVLVVNPPINLSFSPPSSCINTAVQFTNTSTVGAGGGPLTYTWNLGNGTPTTSVTNPNTTYTNSGTFTITLTARSTQGCISVLTQTLGIFPPPILSFSANPLCDIHGTSFSPATSTAISSGSLVGFGWNFGEPSSGAANTSTLASPTHSYAAPGNYVITFSATSNHGCTASTTSTLIISSAPLVSFSTTSAGACLSNYTFANTSTSGTNTITYNWNFGGTGTTSATSPTYSFPGPGTYTVRLIGTNNFGCGDTAVTSLTVFPLPQVTLTVPSPCENSIFTASTTLSSSLINSYNWNFGDPPSGAANTSTLQNPTHIYPVGNNYTITLVVANSVGCSSSASTSILVHPNPVANFTFSTANACTLPYAFVNSSSVSSSPANSVTGAIWDFNGAATSTVTNPSFTFPGPGNYTVSQIAITNFNCMDTIVRNITVHPVPYANFTMVPTCQNDPVTVNSTSSISPIPDPAASIVSHNWNFGIGTNNTANPPPQTYTTQGTYTVTYSITSNQGCVSTASTNLVIHPVPVIDFTTSSNMCLGFVTNFTTNVSIPAGGTINSQSWDFGDAGASFILNPTHTYSAAGVYDVLFSVNSTFGCLTQLTKSLTVYPLPTVTFTGNNVCLGGVTQFAESSTITPGSIVSYTYNFGDGAAPTGTNNLSNPPYTYTNHGTYTPTLSVTSNDGCISSGTTAVLVHALPNIAFSLPNVCENSVAQFSNNSNVASTSTITQYVWDFGDSTPTTNIVSPTHSYSPPATYTVTLTATTNYSCMSSGINTIMIHPFPSGVIPPINSACINGSVSINPTITITGANNPIPGYTLSFGDGSTPVIQQSSITLPANHTYSVNNTYIVSIIANSSNNCPRTFTSTVNVYAKPVVNFSSLNHCFKDVTQFTNSSAIAPQHTITGYSWDFDDGAASTSTVTSPSYSFIAYGVHNVSLTAFSQPESTLSCDQITVKTVTINPPPFLVGFISNSVCLGSATNFNNTTPSSSITAWSWYHSTPGVLTSVAQHPSFTYTQTGVHTVTLVATNSYGCREDTVGQVKIYANPTASFVTDTVCSGLPTQFNNFTLSGDGGVPNYTWSVSGNIFSNLTHPTYVLNGPGSHTVQLKAVTPVLGCTSIYNGIVYVNYPPTVDFNVNDICLNNVAQFNNITNGATTYTWNFGDGNSSNVYSPPHSYLSSGGYSVKLVATNADNCKDSLSKNMIVHALPISNFTLDSVCVGDQVNFVNLSTSSDGSLIAHYWDFDGDNVPDQDAIKPKMTYQITGNFIVRLEVMTQYGCSSTFSKSIYANPKPMPVISSDNQSGCPELCINFKDLSFIAAGTITNTVWNFGDASPPVSNSKNPTHCYGSGVYDLTFKATSNKGCKNELNLKNYVNVYDDPKGGFVVQPAEIDEDDPVISVNTAASNDVVQTRYYLSDGSNFITPNFTHMIKNLNKTNPMLVQIVKNQHGCTDTVYEVLKVRPLYVIYVPNVFTPNEDGKNDTFFAKGVGIIKFAMQIYDRWGHLVWDTKDMTDGWDGTKKGSGVQVKQDVYTWKAQVVDIFNTPHELIGHVTLIR
jgi:gliding motility-associated-like protein